MSRHVLCQANLPPAAGLRAGLVVSAFLLLGTGCDQGTVLCQNDSTGATATFGCEEKVDSKTQTVDSCGCPDGWSHTGQQIHLKGSRIAEVSSLQGGTVNGLTPVSDPACSPFGALVGLAPNALYGTDPDGNAVLSDGEPRATGPSWVHVAAATAGLSGKRIATSACRAGRLLIGTEKGLEWISFTDRSTGMFTSPSGFGSGVTVITPFDSTHVLAGTGPTGPGAILKCDVTTFSCAAMSGYDGAGVTSIVPADNGGSFIALSRDSVTGNATIYQSIMKVNGGAWTKPTFPALKYRGVCADPIPDSHGSPSHLFAWGSGLSVTYSGAGSTWNAVDPPFGIGQPTKEIAACSVDASRNAWLAVNPSSGNAQVWRYGNSGYTQVTTTGATGRAVGLAVTRDGNTSSVVFLATTDGVFRAPYSTSSLSFQAYSSGLGTPAVVTTAKRLVPVVLDVVGLAHYTSELTLTNRGTTVSQVTLQYTASLGAGTGTAHDTLNAGTNLVVPDVISYLRGKGLAIPNDGSAQAGTLLVTFDGLSDGTVASAVARTTAATLAPQPVGSAGLAYSGVDPAHGSTGSLSVYGLRSNATDRSNLAVYNTGSDPVTVSVTVFNGDGSGASTVVSAGTNLPAWGWTQINRVLDATGYATGWATVTRTSATGSFGTYAVINDNATNDGSFVAAAPPDLRPLFLNVPVLVETGSFLSELVLTNSSPKPADFQLSYHESLTPGAAGNTSYVLTIPPMTQQILPGAIDYLRSKNIAVGPQGGGSYAGGLNVTVTSGGGLGKVYAGARTASPSAAGGQFGLFTPAAFAGDEATTVAYVYGLHADANNRSNVAAVNTAQEGSAGSITLSLEVFDGDAAGASRGSETLTLAPGQWGQVSGILAAHGVHNGWVRITRTAGTAPWVAYGVVNDGGGPGQRTGDGAYVPMER